MKLNETIKRFFTSPKPSDYSSEVPVNKVVTDLTNGDGSPYTGAFFDDTQNLFGRTERSEIISRQNDKISKYRQLSMISDINVALDEIVNEIIFTYDDSVPLKIEVNIDNEKLVPAIEAAFAKIVKIGNIKRNIFGIVKGSYIDGQIVAHLAYDAKNTKTGIQSISIIDPTSFYYDPKEGKYRYLRSEMTAMYSRSEDNPKREYSPEEIVREDFGLHDGKVNLSYLEYAIKPANMLKTLEDLLIPLRFSRSISRRVFNVDIGDLPGKRGAEVMREYQNKFKYKKFYNNETGEVSNQQHITSMVEDYWFANRSGGKGTTVDVLDESGNLGEIGDLLYFTRKLYSAMNIPNSRVSIDPDSDKSFDYMNTQVSKDDMKFFMFISRLRQVYSSFFKEILKREVVSTGVMKEKEWDDNEDAISIRFSAENKFIEKMKLDNFQSKFEIYGAAQEYQGKLFPVEKILGEVFRMSPNEIEDTMKQIQKEKKNPLFKDFYKSDEFGDE